MTRRRRLIESEYGIYPQPSDVEKDEVSLAVEPELPVAPGPQMSVQLSVDRPPIEDDEFVPASVEELSRSAAALTDLVPSSQIEFFYKQLHKMLDQANDLAHKPEDDTGTMDDDMQPKPKEGSMKEESIKRNVRNTLLEMLSDEDTDEFERYRYGSEPAEIADEISTSSDAVSLEDLASEFGYSGAPGIRQEIERITSRMEYFASEIDKDDLEALKQFAVGEYVEVLGNTDLLDPEDIADLQQAPTVVQDLDSFRFFFVSAFVLPVYKSLSRAASKKVKSGISDLGLPKELDQSLYNQVSGTAKGGFSIFKRKVDSLIKKGKISPEEGKDVIVKVRSAIPVLKKASEISDDLVSQSLEKWSGMSKKKKAEIVRKSLEQTIEFQG